MDNGLVLNNSVFIPPEILAQILRFVHPSTLIHSCRLVCRSWNEIILDDVWKSIVLRSSNLNSIEKRQVKYPYPFGRNLLRNNSAQDGLEHWLGKKRFEFWKIERIPIGADPLPRECEDFGGHSSCFTTSYFVSEKEQEIDLYQNGISGYLMDVWQPIIIVSEWFASRVDCGCWYRLRVLLLDENRDILHKKSERRKVERGEGKDWQKVIIKFRNYEPGVRYIVFNHAGRDTNCWGGQYGSKMSGGVVRFSIPSSDANQNQKKRSKNQKKRNQNKNQKI